MNEDIKLLIQEWFADASINGKIEVARLYSRIILEIEKQLEFFINDEEAE